VQLTNTTASIGFVFAVIRGGRLLKLDGPTVAASGVPSDSDTLALIFLTLEERKLINARTSTFQRETLAPSVAASYAETIERRALLRCGNRLRIQPAYGSGAGCGAKTLSLILGAAEGTGAGHGGSFDC
jgi:hypothetical protein